jgi:hypothetical protein
MNGCFTGSDWSFDTEVGNGEGEESKGINGGKRVGMTSSNVR